MAVPLFSTLCAWAFGWFPVFTVNFTNKAAVNIHVQMSVCFGVSWKHSGVERLNQMVKCRFNFVRNYRTIFSNDGTILYPPQQCRRLRPFLSSPALGILSVSNFNHSKRCLLPCVIVVVTFI